MPDGMMDGTGKRVASHFLGIPAYPPLRAAAALLNPASNPLIAGSFASIAR